ncbi:MAG TPA: SRPBCC domain-containing protein [Longimicrobiaceae bacterium]|nr:SRPBCC domain-containing protein [Longimicrobiaceae bacterium]
MTEPTDGAGAATLEAASERELVITRVFAAPPPLLFELWTEPEHLARWCAPRDFTIPHSEGELRPGGAWRSCLRAPDGIDYWLGGVYREVVPGERLAFTHAWDDEAGNPGHETLVTLTFAGSGERTEMVFRQRYFRTAESRDGHAEGWLECLDRLGEYLHRLQT